MNEDTWPAFVIEGLVETQRRDAGGERTGWESVVFELDDADLQDWESSFPTAAFAP